MIYKGYTIPKGMEHLATLILECESMKEPEKGYWIGSLHHMNKDQSSKLQDILEMEKIQLEKIEANYKKDIANIVAYS